MPTLLVQEAAETSTTLDQMRLKDVRAANLSTEHRKLPRTSLEPAGHNLIGAESLVCKDTNARLPTSAKIYPCMYA